MEIVKVFNNNAALVLDENEEKVVIGKGIAFNKKPGDLINSSLVSKTFRFSDEKQNLQFQDLLISLPTNQVTAVERIVDEVRSKLNKRVSDVLYISLADHIHYALMNHENNIHIRNNLLYDIMRFYPEEYEIAKKALYIIEEENGVLLPEDEAGFIALHILNCEEDDYIGTKNMIKASELIDQIIELVQEEFNHEISVDSMSWHRFMNHLRYFSLRVVKRSVFNEDEKDKELLTLLSTRYADAFNCALKVRQLIENAYDVEIGNEELLYLTIHIQRATNNEEEREDV